MCMGLSVLSPNRDKVHSTVAILRYLLNSKRGEVVTRNPVIQSCVVRKPVTFDLMRFLDSFWVCSAGLKGCWF